MKLANARVLVTGGAGGIGSAIAAELLSRGAAVLLVGRDPTSLAATASLLERHGDRVSTLAADLTAEEGRQRVSEAAVAWRGGINVLVNNAGVSHFHMFEDQPATQIDQAVATNLLAPLHLCRSLLGHLKRQPQAAILNVGSVFGSIGYPGYAVYSATKFALRGFTEALRRELAGSSVRVRHLAPRATRTSINSEAVERMNDELGVAMDSPQRVARAACDMLAGGAIESVVGWPEKLFARLNAVLPRLVDGALGKQLPVIRRYAGENTPTTPDASAAVAAAAGHI